MHRPAPAATAAPLAPSPARPAQHQQHQQHHQHQQYQPSTAARLILFGALWTAVFVAALDGTIFTTLAGPISTSFHSASTLPLLAGIYYTATASFQPLTGRLSDRLGRRRLLLGSVALFGAGTAVCAAAPSAPLLIAGRAAAGAAAGALHALATFVTSDLVPLRARAKWLAAGNAVQLAGACAGALYGGLVADALGWRAALAAQLPLLALCGAAMALFVPETGPAGRRPAATCCCTGSVLERGEKAGLLAPVSCCACQRSASSSTSPSPSTPPAPLDIRGALTLVAALGLLLAGISAGGAHRPWRHPAVWGAISAGLAGLALFVRTELRAPEPILPVRLFLGLPRSSPSPPGSQASLSLSLPILWATLANMAIVPLQFFLPLYLRYSSSSSSIPSSAAIAALTIPQLVGGALGSIGTGIAISRSARYIFPARAAALALALTTALLGLSLSLSAPSSPPPLALLCAATAATGAAYGSTASGSSTALLAAAASAAGQASHATATAASYALRSVGAALAVALSAALVQHGFRAAVARECVAAAADPADCAAALARLAGGIERLLEGGPPAGPGGPEEWRRAVVRAYVGSMRGVWALSAGLAAVAVLVAFCIRDRCLDEQPEQTEEPEE